MLCLLFGHKEGSLNFGDYCERCGVEYPVKDNILCLIFGHKEIDCGDGAKCERCERNTYFDMNSFCRSGYLLAPFYWVKWSVYYPLRSIFQDHSSDYPFILIFALMIQL